MASANKGKEYSLAVKIAGSVSSSFNSAMGAAENRISGLGTIAKQAAAVAAAAWGALKIGEFVKDSIQSAVNFESAMADVAKVVDGLRDDNGNLTDSYYAMSDSIVQMSKDIPMAAEDLAAITASAGTAGIAAEELTTFTETAAKMGVAFDTTAEQAGDWMAKWRTSFSMGQEEVTALADQINYLSNNSASTASELSTIVTAVGPLGDVAGISAAQIAALGSAMVGVGVQQDVAATGIKKMATTMVAGASATDTQAAVLEKLGMDATDLAVRMQDDAVGAILSFLDAVSQLPKAEQAAALKDYFGQESVGAIAPLLTNLDVLRQRFEMVADAQLYAGSMDAEYAARAATTANNIQLYENRIAALKIQIGDYLLPVVNKVLGVASTGLDWISGKVSAAEGIISTAIGAVRGKALEIFEAIRPKLESIGAKATEVFSTLAGYLGSAFEAVQPALSWIIDVAIPTAVGVVLDLVDAFGSAVLVALDFKEVLVAAAAVYGAFKAGKALQSMIQGFQQAKVTLALFKATTQGANIAQAAFNGTLTIGETLTALFTGQVTLAQLAQAGWATVTGAVTKAFGALNAVLMANPIVLIVVAIAAVIAIIVVLYNKCEWFREKVDAIIGFIADGLGSFLEFFKTNILPGIQAVWDSICKAFSAAWDFIQAVWNSVTAYFKAIFDTIAGIFSAVTAVLHGDFAGAWEAIKGVFSSWGAYFQSLWDGVKAIFGSVADWFGTTFTAAWTAVKNVFSTGGEIFMGIVDGILDGFKTVVNGIIGGLNAVIKVPFDGINAALNGIRGVDIMGLKPFGWIGTITVPQIPMLAQGGIVDSPTILEAGEAGTEAIIPLAELWSQMQGMISGSIGAIADRLEAAEVGSSALTISELLAALQNGGHGPDPAPGDPDGGGPVYHITYAPQYCFEGGAPSREDMTDAEHISQEEFERRMNQWMKDNARKRF